MDFQEHPRQMRTDTGCWRYWLTEDRQYRIAHYRPFGSLARLFHAQRSAYGSGGDPWETFATFNTLAAAIAECERESLARPHAAR